MEVIYSLISILSVVIGIWIATEIGAFISAQIVEAFRGGGPGPNAPVPQAEPRPVRMAYRPVAVRLYQSWRAAA